MFKYFILTLFALHCNCQQVVELSRRNVVQPVQSLYNWPARTVNGFSTLGSYGDLSSVSSPVSSYSSYSSPLSYGLGYGSIGGLRTIGGLGGYQSVNVAPSPYSYLQGSVQRLAFQPAHQTIHVQQPASIAIAQPALALAQPASLSIAQPAQVHFAQPALAIARHQSVAIQPQVYAQQQQSIHPVTAAVHQVGRTVEYRPVPFNDQPIVPQVVEVEPSDQPINIHFKSRSSTVRLSQEHIAGEPGSVEQTQSQDEPSKVVHEVIKPVIQEVREVIQPYRQVTQEVQPVVENVHTVVSHGEGQRQQYVAEQQIVRPQIQTLQHVVQPVQHVVQPVAVQQLHAVAQPVAHVQQLHAVAQPVAQYHSVVREVQSVPQYQTFSQVVPQFQSFRSVQQPIVSSIQRFGQPIGISAFSQPAVGVSQSVLSPISRFSVQQQQPSFSVRQVSSQVSGGNLVREQNTQSNNLRDFAESD